MDAKFTKRFESLKKSLDTLNEAYDGDIIKQNCDKIIAVYIDIFYQFYDTAEHAIRQCYTQDR